MVFNNDKSKKAYILIALSVAIFLVVVNWHWFNENSGAITAIATLILAVITYFYLKELQQQRRDIQKPIIEITPIKKDDKYLICVTNNGPGVALDIKRKVYGEKQNSGSQILYEDTRGRPLQSGKGFKYLFEANLLKDMDTIRVEISFKEVFGKDGKTKRVFRLSDLQEWNDRERNLFEHFYGID